MDLYAPDGAEIGMRLLGAIGRFWSSRDYLAREPLEWRKCSPGPRPCSPLCCRAMALNAGARLADNQNDWTAVRAYCVEIIAIQERLGNLQGLSKPYVLAKAASAEDDFDAARDLLETGVEVARAAGTTWATRTALTGWASLPACWAITTRPATTTKAAWQLPNAGHSQGIGFVLHNLAHVYLHDGDHARAAALLDEAIFLYRVLGNRLGTAMCVAAMSGVALGQGVARRAARLLGAAQALLESVGALLDPADVMEYRHNEATARARLGEAAFLVAWAEGHAMTP